MNAWSKILRVIMILLALIGIVMVIRRTLIIRGVMQSFNPTGGPPFDSGFTQHPVITFLHILPGGIFMILGPVLFFRGFRKAVPYMRGVYGILYITAAYITGVSAVIMPFINLPIGGINEAAASILFGLFFLFSLSKAVGYISAHKTDLYREWMIRMFAIGLAISTVRPIMAMFFAFSGKPPQVFFGTAFWIGFTLHFMVAESWINYTRTNHGSNQ